MSMCVLIGKILVSACRCEIGVDRVQPVIMRSALFCIVCSLCRFVLDSEGSQAGVAYVSTDLMYCL